MKKKHQQEILKSTKKFAKLHGFHYDRFTAAIVLDAIQKTEKIVKSEPYITQVENHRKRLKKNCKHFLVYCYKCHDYITYPD